MVTLVHFTLSSRFAAKDVFLISLAFSNDVLKIGFFLSNLYILGDEIKSFRQILHLESVQETGLF